MAQSPSAEPFCFNEDLTSENYLSGDPTLYYEKSSPVRTAPAAKIESVAVQETEPATETAVPEGEQVFNPASETFFKEMIDKSVDEKVAALKSMIKKLRRPTRSRTKPKKKKLKR